MIDLYSKLSLQSKMSFPGSNRDIIPWSVRVMDCSSFSSSSVSDRFREDVLGRAILVSNALTAWDNEALSDCARC